MRQVRRTRICTRFAPFVLHEAELNNKGALCVKYVL